MYIDSYMIEVHEKPWDEKKQAYSKEKKVVASITDHTGIGCKGFGKFLDDLSDNNVTFRGRVTVSIIIDKEEY